MLRASKTLQRQNDTRRLCSMSMNRKVQNTHEFSRAGAAGLVLGEAAEIRCINLHRPTNFK
jgi:hypothetical protein